MDVFDYIIRIVLQADRSVAGKRSAVIVNAVAVNGKIIDNGRNQCQQEVLGGLYRAENSVDEKA